VHDERCPDCESLVDSQDEPCPQCASLANSNEGLVLSYQYSKTFTLRYAPLRPYRPERFIAEINEWLQGERGLVDVPSLVIQSNQGLVTEVTLSCVGINRPTYRLFQIERVVLVKGQFRRQGTKLGEALNTWRETNPGRQLLRFRTFSAAGVAYEVWLLFVEVVPTQAPVEETFIH
jgi:hypothetical protein